MKKTAIKEKKIFILAKASEKNTQKKKNIEKPTFANDSCK